MCEERPDITLAQGRSAGYRLRFCYYKLLTNHPDQCSRISFDLLTPAELLIAARAPCPEPYPALSSGSQAPATAAAAAAAAAAASAPSDSVRRVQHAAQGNTAD